MNKEFKLKYIEGSFSKFERSGKKIMHMSILLKDLCDVDIPCTPDEKGANIRNNKDSQSYKNKVYVELGKSVEGKGEGGQTQTLFGMKNCGIFIIASHYKIVDNCAILTCDDYQGVANGGHTYQKIVEKLRGEDNSHNDEFVNITITVGLSKDESAEVARALNQSVKVSDTSDYDKRGFYDTVKTALKPKFRNTISWYQGQVEGGHLPGHVMQILAVASPMYYGSFYPIHEDVGNSIRNPYRHPEHFARVMGYTNTYSSVKDVNNKVAHDIKVQYQMSDIINEVIELYDWMSSELAKHIIKHVDRKVDVNKSEDISRLIRKDGKLYGIVKDNRSLFDRDTSIVSTCKGVILPIFATIIEFIIVDELSEYARFTHNINYIKSTYRDLFKEILPAKSRIPDNKGLLAFNEVGLHLVINGVKNPDKYAKDKILVQNLRLWLRTVVQENIKSEEKNRVEVNL